MVVLAIPLLVLLAAFVAYGSASLARTTWGGWLGWVANTALGASFIGASLVKAIVNLSGHVTHALGAHFAQIEHATSAWVSALADALDRTGRVALTFPFDVSTFAYWLVRRQIPRLIHAIPGAATKVLHSVTTRVVRIERTVVKLPKLSRAQARALVGAAVATYVAPYLLPLRWLRSHFHALTAVLPHTLPIPFGRTIANIKKRLRALERATPLGLAVAVVVAAFAKLGLGWLRCRNPSKIGKALCGVPWHFADDLLSLFTDYLVVTNICRVLPWMERGFADVAAPLVSQLSKAGAGACGAGVTPASSFDVPQLYLPTALEL